MLTQQRHALFPQSQTETLDLDLFRQPSSKYRGAPFWAWNNRLDLDAIAAADAHLSRRWGWADSISMPAPASPPPIWATSLWRLYSSCVDAAKAQGLYVWLYDEDRWPSGAAGGLVTQDPQYRARHLLLTARPYHGQPVAPQFTSLARGQRNENGDLARAVSGGVATADTLASYRRLAADEPPPDDGTVWYAYAETAIPSPWFNNQTYVDTLNPAAIAAFIAATHERYRAVVGDEFGRTIPAIFTDEPQFTHKRGFSMPRTRPMSSCPLRMTCSRPTRRRTRNGSKTHCRKSSGTCRGVAPR